MNWTSTISAAFLLTGASNAVPVEQELQDAEIPARTANPDIVAVGSDRQKRLTVPVSIDGSGPYKFMIDTGSERTVVSRTLASDLQLEFAARANLMSMAGTRIVDTVYVPDLALGKQNYGEVVAPLLEAHHMGAEGILGLDGLQDQRILFNFAEEQIEIEENNSGGINRGYEIVVRAKRINGQLIFADATLSGIKVNVVIDTGAQTNIGNRALQDKLRSRRAKGLGEQSELTSVTGQKIIADSGVARNFRIGKAQFDTIPIAFADSPPFQRLKLDDKPALFLGMATLRQFDRVAIDFEKRRVYFDVPHAPRTNPRNSTQR